MNGPPHFNNFSPNSVSQLNKEGGCTSQPRGSSSGISAMKAKKKSREKKGKREKDCHESQFPRGLMQRHPRGEENVGARNANRFLCKHRGGSDSEPHIPS